MPVLKPESRKSVLWACIWAAVGVAITWQLWGIIFTTSPRMSVWGIFGDEAVVTQAAVRVTNGQLPHRDFYSYTIGSAYYPLAVWMKVIGQDYANVRWYNLITALALVAVIIWLGSLFSRWSGVTAGLFFAFFAFPIWPFVSYHWQFLFFAVLGTCFLVMKPTTSRLTLAGLALVGAGLTLPNKALFLGLAQILFITITVQRGRRCRSIALLLSGSIFIGGVAIAFLYSNNLLGTVWNQLVTNNVTFYPTLVHKSIFGFNSNSYVMVLISGILCLPLLVKSWLRDEWHRAYMLLALSQLVLVVAILYQSTWEHFIQISAIFLVLLSVIVFDRLWHSWRMLRLGNPEKFLHSLLVLFLFSGVGIWFFPKLFSLAPLKYQVPFETPRGRIYVASLQPAPGSMTSHIQIIDRLLRTTLAGRRVFFFPYMPGYYYFYNVTNPTAYDILPSAQPPQGDVEKLKRELLENADALVYINSWPDFAMDSALMDWMREKFPVVTVLSYGRIQVYEKTLNAK